MSNLNFSILSIYLITQKTNKRVPTVRQISFGALAPQNMCYKQCAHKYKPFNFSNQTKKKDLCTQTNIHSFNVETKKALEPWVGSLTVFLVCVMIPSGMIQSCIRT